MKNSMLILIVAVMAFTAVGCADIPNVGKTDSPAFKAIMVAYAPPSALLSLGSIWIFD